MGIFKKEKQGKGKTTGWRVEVPDNAISATGLPSPANPLNSPDNETAPIMNILPSYQLYESTFSKVVDPSADNSDDEPPTYEISPLQSPSSQGENSYFPNAEIARRSLYEPRWENSILANAHLMKHVDDFDKSVADKLKIDIVLTRKPGEKGKAPDIYDPMGLEFLQGDSLHGYIVVVNNSDKALSFELISVMLEGCVSVYNTESPPGTKPLVLFKFLNMFDYNASWTPAYFEQMSAEDPECVDPVDNTLIQFPNKRKLQPGVAYKKFFNFTIPQKLLEYACRGHEMPEHCLVIPSIGLDKRVFLQRIRKQKENYAKRGERPKKIPPQLYVRDYGLPGTSISYSLETKVFGRKSTHERFRTESKDEFIIIKEETLPLRVIPKETLVWSRADEDAAEKQLQLFSRTVRDIIEKGKALQEGINEVSRKPSTAKHTYSGSTRDCKLPVDDDNYVIVLPYKKKQLTQPAKVVGSIIATVPKWEHILSYRVPSSHASVCGATTVESGRLRTSINLEYVSSGKTTHLLRPPEIRGIVAQVVVNTLGSEKHSIPIILSRTMQFKNVPGPKDSVQGYVIDPFAKYLKELTELSGVDMKKLGLTQQIAVDVKALARMKLKTNFLKIEGANCITKGAIDQWSISEDENKAKKTIEIDVDFQSLFAKESKRSMDDSLVGSLALIPTFQSCIICRYYYLLVEIKLGNGETFPVKVPFRIAK